MKIRETFKEIQAVVRALVHHGLSIEEKLPCVHDGVITWQNQKDLSIVLKNLQYTEKYKILLKNGNYNLKMLDGALIQMMYSFSKGKKEELLSHRLAFFPSPFMMHYDSYSHEYEDWSINSEFLDLIEKNIVPVPIRFDYNNDVMIFKEFTHPYAHASFGEYKACRIAVSNPITPSMFVNFLIRNFYNTAFMRYPESFHISSGRFEGTITRNETKILHLSIQ